MQENFDAMKAQMKPYNFFNFFFDLCFGQRHYSLTDNLSKTLQKEKILAVSGQCLASLIAKTKYEKRFRF